MLVVEPFNDEKPATQDYRTATTVSGSDLGETNVYRQGIELTMPAHYFMGSVKISSGYLNHLLPQQHFGQTRQSISDETWFLDIDTYNPLTFINLKHDTSSTSSVLHSYEGSFPVISSNDGITPDIALDGILEPLTIRPRASFFSVESPFESHDLHASMTAGNEDKDGSSDRIEDVYELSSAPNMSTFLDSADTIGSAVVVGDYEPVKNVIVPWADSIISSGSLFSANMDPDLRAALTVLGSFQDSLVPPNSKSTTSGFSYDTAAGTDSLAFGGFFYVSSSVSLPPT